MFAYIDFSQLTICNPVDTEVATYAGPMGWQIGQNMVKWVETLSVYGNEFTCSVSKMMNEYNILNNVVFMQKKYTSSIRRSTCLIGFHFS